MTLRQICPGWSILLAELLRVHPDEPEPDRVEYIVACLRSGKVVGIPTDTFYGLAVDPVNLRPWKAFMKSRPVSSTSRCRC